jgi:hypothetical protein
MCAGKGGPALDQPAALAALDEHAEIPAELKVLGGEPGDRQQGIREVPVVR